MSNIGTQLLGIAVVATLGFVISGCAEQAASTNVDGSPVAKANATPETTLIASYRHAHTAKDLAAFEKLVCWDKVEGSMRDFILETAQADFEKSIKDIQVVDRTPDQMTEYERKGVKMKTNLDVVGNLKIELEGGRESEWSSYPVGMKDGKFLITTAVVAD